MGQNSENQAKFWKSGEILKIGQHFENRPQFWKFGEILKIWRNFENWAKFWKSGKILKIGQFWIFWSARHIPPKISPTNPRVIYQMTRARYFLSQIFWDKWRTGTNDARAWNARRYAMFTRGNYNDKVSKKWKCRPLDWSLSLDLKASCLHPWYSEADRFYWRHRQPVGAGKFNLGGGKGGILTTNWMQWGWKWWSTSLAFKVVIYLSDIHGRLVGDPAVTLGQSWRVVRGERVKVGVVEPNLDRSSKVEDMIDISFWSPSAWSASCSTS